MKFWYDNYKRIWASLKNIIIFIFSTFFSYYPTFISNEKGKERERKKRMCFSFIVFRAVFRAYKSVEMCLWLIRKVYREKKVTRALTTHFHNMLSTTNSNQSSVSSITFNKSLNKSDALRRTTNDEFSSDVKKSLY